MVLVVADQIYQHCLFLSAVRVCLHAWVCLRNPFRRDLKCRFLYIHIKTCLVLV